jgi:hypothetical protein
MRPERRDLHEQERSIKDREQELFVEREEAPPEKPPVKPFAIYLRETPADPMATEVKVLLWIIAIVVLLLFVGALWRTQRASRSRVRESPPQQSVRFAPGPHYPGAIEHDKMGAWRT